MSVKVPKHVGKGYSDVSVDVGMYVEESTSEILSPMQTRWRWENVHQHTFSARRIRVSPMWHREILPQRHIVEPFIDVTSRKSMSCQGNPLRYVFFLFYILFSFLCYSSSSSSSSSFSSSSSSSSSLLRFVSIAYFYYSCSFFIVFLTLCFSLDS